MRSNRQRAGARRSGSALWLALALFALAPGLTEARPPELTEAEAAAAADRAIAEAAATDPQPAEESGGDAAAGAETGPEANNDAAVAGTDGATATEETTAEGREPAAGNSVGVAAGTEEGASRADVAAGGASPAEAPPAQEEAAAAPAIAEGDTGAALAAEGAGGSAFPPELTDPEIPLEELTVRLVPLTKSELSTLAAEWLVIVRQKTREMAEAQIAIMRTEGDVEDAVRERLTELTGERKALFDRFSTVVDSWDKKGGDQAAVADFRAYRNAIIVEETRTADFETLLAQALSWLTSRDGGIELAIDLAVIVASVAGLLVAARLVRRFAGRYIGHVKALSKLLQAFLVALVYWLVLAFGLMIVLSALGVDISPVFALIGGASFILAFAFQDTLGNLASGLMIMINRPFDEGDYVDVGGTAGTVRSVSIVATEVVTPDNQVIVIPNKTVWGNVITNVTASATRRVDLTFGISYGDDIGRAMRILEETVEAHPLTLSVPEPTIVVGALGASSVDILCRPWSRTADYWTVYWDLTRQVKERFDAAGITIPFPQQEVHMHAAREPSPAPTRLAGLAFRSPHSGSASRRPAPTSEIARGEAGHDTGEGERG